MAKLNTSYKRWSLDCHDVSTEILEDLGLSALGDDSSSNSPVKGEPAVKKPEHGIKRKECSPIQPSITSTDFSEDDHTNDSFLLSKRMRVEGPPGLDGFSRLSDEVILCILKWLPKSTIAKCAQVSKRWKRLAYDEALWKRIDLSGNCLKPTILGTVLLRGTQILRLAKTEVIITGLNIFENPNSTLKLIIQVCDPIYPPNAPLPHFCPSFHNLHYLDLSMAAISSQGIQFQQTN